MKRWLGILLSVLALTGMGEASGWLGTGGSIVFTTDIIELFQGEYGIEMMYNTSLRTSFAARLGSYRYLEDSDRAYPEDQRRWEIGGRWRTFLLDTAPNLLFVGFGFDNRPKDSSVTPLGEVGVNLNYSFLCASLIAFGGYEIHLQGVEGDRWVTGIELRAGITF